MHLTELATIGIVLLLGCMSPGPDFVAVTSQALVSRGHALRVALGISLAITAWATLSVFGLTLVLSRLDGLYTLMRWIGAAYLIWLGLQLLYAAVKGGTSAPGPVARAAWPGGIRRGLLLGLTNPKAAVFFSSLFVTLLPSGAPVWVYGVVVALAAITALGWFAVVAVAFSTVRVQQVYCALQRPIDALTGALLTAIGLHLALLN